MGKRSKRQNKDPLEMKNMAKTRNLWAEETPIGCQVLGAEKRLRFDSMEMQRWHGWLKPAASDRQGNPSISAYLTRMPSDSAKLLTAHRLQCDPFCGGGTVLIEAGCWTKSLWLDISPIAHRLRKPDWRSSLVDDEAF